MLAALLLASIVTQPPPVPTAQTGERIVLSKVAKGPAVDGTLSDPEWEKNGAKIVLGWNLRDQQPAAQSTVAFVLTDGTYLYVGFDARQQQRIAAGQHTNDASLNDNDTVSIDLWPNGVNGFAYAFESNPIGTHAASSSENTAYAPDWKSAGRENAGGYTVTMRIPLKAIKGGSSTAWRAQLTRYIASTQDDFVWQHAAQQGAGNDAVSIYSGFFTGVPVQTALRPRPRIGVYELGELAAPRIGGSTARMGADISLPVTSGTSLVATLHPDYSNVELDQQTIQPTAYARFYQEVRPFFTQLQNFFNNESCIGCTGQELYTPNIPAPRDGFAIEGKQGAASFAAFDAAGVDGRNDAAQSFGVRTADTKASFFAQHIGVNLPGVSDSTTVYNAVHDSDRGLFEYLTYGSERGTFVTNPREAQRREAGVGLYAPNGGIYMALRSIGAQYAPYDGLFAQSDIAGYDLNGDYTWYYKPESFISRFIVAGNVDRYHGALHGLDQTDTSFAAGADIHKLWHVRLQTGSSYLLTAGIFTPVTQNGVDLYYHYHTPTVTQLSYATGRFGPGRVDSWIRSTTLKAGARAYLSLEADDNVQYLDAGGSYTSWLEKATYTYENGSNSSIGIGVRRITGAFPIVTAAYPNPALSDWNLSLAYHVRFNHMELYAVYGDANALQTQQRFIIKLIEYAGAEKGT